MPHNPHADPAAIVISRCGRARFTMLTERLVRLQWSGHARFEDRASQAFINRRLPVPAFRVERSGVNLRIITDRLSLHFREDGKAFHARNLRIDGGVADRPFSWSPGDEPRGNLGGTIRTLDNVNGRCGVEPGIMSRDGWALVDDSRSLVLRHVSTDAAGGPRSWDWPTVRHDPDAIDWYFFGHGHDYRAALRDFTAVAGSIPLPPRYVLGSWWSRYWAYTEDELISLVEEFREHDVPLDVLVIDMDWHLDGWTGYTWNPTYFPDPQRFLDWTNAHGLQITLNLHPADGVGNHEAAFEPMCRELGIDPRTTDRISFDCTDPGFVESYFKHLHWPLEHQGVDFWWMDWQQGTETKIPGLDPLWWLNHLHWKDLEERSDPENDPDGIRRERRPLIFSRWGGLGNHRYPIGFSGDTFSTWESLAWQPEFTAMAGNVGYAWWSHDIGGHQPGPVDPELYARWVQYGALSPILRTHTSKNPQGERRIWASPDREFKAMREAFRLRYRLIPYFYTAARRTCDESLPLCRPLYYQWPEEEGAYDERFRHQYMLGDDLLAAPVVRPGDQAARCASAEIWIPPGMWTHWYTGETIEGPRIIRRQTTIEEIPLFARGGAIIPAAPVMKWSSERPLDPLTLIVWPGGSEHDGFCNERGGTVLYEDDGESVGYLRGEFARTPVSFTRSGDLLRLVIEPAEGSHRGMPMQRGYEIRIVDRWPASKVRVGGVALPRLTRDENDGLPDCWEYDEAKLTIVIRLSPRSVRMRTEIEVKLDSADERPLRCGIHGRLKLLESLGAMLGEHAPEALRAAASGRLRQSIISRRAAGCPGHVLTDDERWLAAREIAHSAASPDQIREAVARLLEISASILIGQSQGGWLEIKALAECLADRPIAEMKVVITPPHDGDSDSSRPVENAAGFRSASECIRLLPRRPLSLTTIPARVTLTRSGESITFLIQDTIFPSINAWLVVGPFDCPFEVSMATPFGPERTGDLEPRGDEAYEAASPGGSNDGTPRRWRPVVRDASFMRDPHAEFVVDLHAAFGRHCNHAVAYAMTSLHVDEDRDLVLALGSDDVVAVWLNGRKEFENDVQRGYGSRQDRVPLRLRRGRNTLLLKITQAVGAWAFGAHLIDEQGSPAEGIRVVLQDCIDPHT